jgi:23S rRNA (guanosine2251-2'-O)-methyltransferase
MSRGSKPVREKATGRKGSPKGRTTPVTKAAAGPERRGRASGPSRVSGSARSAKKAAPRSARSSRPVGRSSAASSTGAPRRSAVGAASVATGAGARRPATRTVGGAGGGRAPARAKADRGLGGEQVEGRHAVRELLLAGRRKVYEVWVALDLDDAVLAEDIAELAMGLGVPVREVTRAKFFAEARTEAPQGVLAKARELPEVDLEDLVLRSKGGPAPFLVAVDGVTDPGNLGALLRSAEGAGVTGIVLPRHRAVHITPTVTKAAAGAVEHLPLTIVGGLPTAITRVRELGLWVVGLDEGGTDSLFDLKVADEPVMLVLGAEGSGLSRLVRQRCDVVAAIPLGGRLASLNVAAAGALACFEVRRRRLASGAAR